MSDTQNPDTNADATAEELFDETSSEARRVSGKRILVTLTATVALGGVAYGLFMFGTYVVERMNQQDRRLAAQDERITKMMYFDPEGRKALANLAKKIRKEADEEYNKKIAPAVEIETQLEETLTQMEEFVKEQNEKKKNNTP